LQSETLSIVFHCQTSIYHNTFKMRFKIFDKLYIFIYVYSTKLDITVNACIVV